MTRRINRKLLVLASVFVLPILLTMCGGQESSNSGCAPYQPYTPSPPDTTPPTAPTSLIATTLSPSQISLSWGASTDNVGLRGYKIYRDGVFLSNAYVYYASYTVQKLDPARQYCFTVSAYDHSGNESGKSNSSCATTLPDLTPPTVPANLSARADLQTGIVLTWAASTDDGDVAGNLINRDGALIGTTADTWFTDTGLSTETQYCYTVQAFDTSGKQSAPSDQACASTSWKYATIDSNVDVQYTSIAIDASDKPHIAYYDGRYTGTYQQVDTVNYATNLSGTWQSAVIDSVAPTVYGALSLLVNADGGLHVAYYDFPNYRLKHAMKTSGAWITESIDSNASNVTSVSMAHDAAGKLHLVFNPNGSVTYMTNATGTWKSTVIGANGVIYGNAATCAIAVDAAGKAYVGYYDYTNHVLKYVSNALGSWATETVDGAADVGLHTAIAVDADGKAHLSYYDVTNGDLKYATNAAGSWVTETVDSIGDVGTSAAIALDANGHPHISYTDATSHSLKYATNMSGSWATYIIDSTTFVGGYTSIAVDSTGKIHISYRGDTYLRYATNR